MGPGSVSAPSSEDGLFLKFTHSISNIELLVLGGLGGRIYVAMVLTLILPRKVPSVCNVRSVIV